VQRTIRKLGIFVGLPLAAIALAVFLLGWGAGSTQQAHAQTQDANFSVAVKGGTCSSDGSEGIAVKPAAPVKGAAQTCNVNAGATFTVNFNLVSGPMWAGYDLFFNWDGNVNYKVGSLKQQAAQDAKLPGTPNCGFPVGELLLTGTAKTDPTQLGNGNLSTGCAASDALDHTFTGTLAQVDFVCKASGSGHITLKHGLGNTDLANAAGSSVELAAGNAESLLINCVPTPATFTPVPTATPPAIPFVQKSCIQTVKPIQPPAPTPSVTPHPVGETTSGPICNSFLVRNGAKIPPAICKNGTGGTQLAERISGPISTLSKGLPQQLGAFEFEMRFDPKLVCVSVVGAGPFAPSPSVVCSTLDNGDKGLIRFGCFTIKKNNNLNAACIPSGCPLAIITVKAQPEVFSQLRPNQDNGIPVQILNQGCQLSDDQGVTIPISSCEDADITFRFLEGDVTGPDCGVNALDAQNIAMRWGARVGSLLYNPFMDLSPSGQVKGDGRIDIQDLQFVFGRLNSTCNAPWPAQLAVNPKA
jgi:hypothetical protein